MADDTTRSSSQGQSSSERRRGESRDSRSSSRTSRRPSRSSRSPRRFQQRRRKTPPVKIEEIDWKNLKALRYFLEGDGSLRPRRKTGASATYQRRVALAVKRARFMALLPYTSAHILEMGQRLDRDLPDLRRVNRRALTPEAEEA